MKYLISLCIFLVLAFPCEGRTITVFISGKRKKSNNEERKCKNQV